MLCPSPALLVGLLRCEVFECLLLGVSVLDALAYVTFWHTGILIPYLKNHRSV